MSYKDARGHTVPAGTDQASRQSLLDLSLSIPSIPARPSYTAATQYVTALADAGVTISAAAPVLVWRTDLQQMVSFNGTGWNIVTPGTVSSTTFAGISSYSSSQYWLHRQGTVVFFNGVIRPNTGSIPARRVTNIAIVPSGWRPSSNYASLGLCQLAATIYVNGATNPAVGGAVVEIDPSSGNLHVTVPQTATVAKVTGHYLIS